MTAKRLATVIFILALVTPAPTTAAAIKGAEPLIPIASLDVPRYMGKWYEISKFRNWFQKKCIGYTSAEYSIQPDANVQVINRCRLENGETSEAIGAARQVVGLDSPRLEVRFAPAWLSFIPGVWGDYWVIDLDADYQLVAVSEPKREYLWVLSRTPQVEPKAYAALLQRLADKGFDVSKLEVTKQ
jgi:apolipoprotein D and lipocalin family protein